MPYIRVMAKTPKSSGYLVHAARGWSARLTRTSKLIPLHTTDRELAELRLRELVAGTHPGENVVETFRTASTRIVDALERDGMRTAGERLSRLQRYAWPTLGPRPVTEIRPGMISDVLASAAATGISQQTIHHLRTDLSVVFRELVRDEIIPSNPATAEKVRTPKGKRDTRRRALLTDQEFAVFLRAPTTPRQLAVMALCSRAFGGLRTSDLHAWQWEDVDTLEWGWADAPRPKTEHHHDAPRERLALPALVVAHLRAWWLESGGATSGPVFPDQRHSYARALRYALRLAGVLRHELHHETEATKPVDFHSFRRAFVTAVAASGLNAQTAMRLAGHRSMTTHQRYHLPDLLEIPAVALPEGAGGEDFDAAMANFEP